MSNGSHWTEPWGNSTDPSSENSSIDRIQPGPKADPGEAYGFNGFTNGPQFSDTILEEYGQPHPNHHQPAYGESMIGQNGAHLHQYQRGLSSVPSHGPPAPPPKDSLPPKLPAKYSAMGGARQKELSGPSRVDGPGDKRRSWLKKRFSKV